MGMLFGDDPPHLPIVFYIAALHDNIKQRLNHIVNVSPVAVFEVEGELDLHESEEGLTLEWQEERPFVLVAFVFRRLKSPPLPRPIYGKGINVSNLYFKQ